MKNTNWLYHQWALVTPLPGLPSFVVHVRKSAKKINQITPIAFICNSLPKNISAEKSEKKTAIKAALID